MKPTVIDPRATTRAAAYDLWMNAPNPMVTVFKTLDVTPLVNVSRKRGLKFNMLLCWCIGRAASQVREFYTLPVGRQLLRYDTIAVNTIVKNSTGEVGSCDVPFSSSLIKFNRDYLHLTRQTAESCENHDLPDSMVIGTSAIVDIEIDGAVGMNSGIFNTPSDLGQIPPEIPEGSAPPLLPVSPHTDRRRSRRPFSGASAKSDLRFLKRGDI